MKVEVEMGVTCLQNKAAKDGQSEKLREARGRFSLRGAWWATVHGSQRLRHD